jgi:hypothetical protein
MSNVPRELLDEAFVKPIRFALILDDQFPTYASAAAPGETGASDHPRAVGLFDMCRRNGWLCDIDNGFQVAERFEDNKHLHQSDLLVLDYHLEPAKPEDPTRALGILQKLASSPHFNLVVIYTSAEPPAVARDVAYALGAGKQVDPQSISYWEGEGNPDDFNEDLSVELLNAHLAGESLPESARAIRQRLEDDFGVKPAFQERHLRALLDKKLSSGMADTTLNSRRADSGRPISFDASANVPWITSGNVFVTVVNKREEPSVLINRLLDALASWDPEPLRVLMTHARSALEKTGSMAESLALGDARKQSGLLLYLLLSKTDTEQERRLVELYSRLSSDLARTADARIVSFGKRLLGLNQGANSLSLARSGSRLKNSVADGAIYHALNEYLSTDRSSDDHVTTGIVFTSETSKGKGYWLCTSPACDLVPGQSMHGLSREIAPSRPATAARLRRVANQASVFACLKQAERGRHIFITEGAELVALEVTDDHARQMDLEVIFLGEAGAIANGAFNGSILSKDKHGALCLETRTFNVVARLRNEYAGRLLTLAGHQAGRIGVDFLDLPDDRIVVDKRSADAPPDAKYA